MTISEQINAGSLVPVRSNCEIPVLYVLLAIALYKDKNYSHVMLATRMKALASEPRPSTSMRVGA